MNRTANIRHRTPPCQDPDALFPHFIEKLRDFVVPLFRKPTVLHLMDDGHSSTYSRRVVLQHDAIHLWYPARRYPPRRIAVVRPRRNNPSLFRAQSRHRPDSGRRHAVADRRAHRHRILRRRRSRIEGGPARQRRRAGRGVETVRKTSLRLRRLGGARRHGPRRRRDLAACPDLRTRNTATRRFSNRLSRPIPGAPTRNSHISTTSSTIRKTKR